MEIFPVVIYHFVSYLTVVSSEWITSTFISNFLSIQLCFLNIIHLFNFILAIHACRTFEGKIPIILPTALHSTILTYIRPKVFFLFFNRTSLDCIFGNTTNTSLYGYRHFYLVIVIHLREGWGIGNFATHWTTQIIQHLAFMYMILEIKALTRRDTF